MGTLFNTGEERHAFVIGVFELLPPWPSRYKLPADMVKEFCKEAHYYAFGRGIGAGVLAGLVFWGVKALAGG